jgi:hypothetical protein
MVENLGNHKFTNLLLKGLGATHVKYGVLPIKVGLYNLKKHG